MLTANDGAPDKFPIDISRIPDGVPAYDNEALALMLYGADATTTLGGGSIVIHTK